MRFKKCLVAVTILVTAIIIISLFVPKPSSLTLEFPKIQDEKKAIFVSYIEYQDYIKNQDIRTAKANLITMLDNMEKLGFNMIIAHVRSFSDAVYPSKLFPSSEVIVNKEGDELPFDILEFIIKEAHLRHIEIHAWINPYRIRNSTNIDSISKNNPCYKWLGSNKLKVIPNKGIFYNPASREVRTLVLEGIKEILDNYEVDGIHFDDYFYPDHEIDRDNYASYINEGGKLSLTDYRLEEVNKLVRATYELVHSYNKIFGISPEGNIDNNYASNYADTKRWMGEKGYIDYIMPQIYFGFLNERKPFLKTILEWNSYIKLDDIKLLPALAFYKTGSKDNYAVSGSTEWQDNQNIIMKQVIASRGVSHYMGFSLFRYDYIFGDRYKTETTMKETEELLKLLIHS